MAKKSRGGRRSSSAATTIKMSSASSSATLSNASFSKFTDSDAAKLRKAMDANYDSDVTDSIKLYTSPKIDRQGYSYSQNLNYKLDNGIALNATEKFIDRNIQNGMHDLGKNATMERYCHDDILKKCGIKDYTKMSQAQLKSQLVGTVFDTTAYTSYAYDNSKNPFRPGAAGGNGREVTLKTNMKSNTKVVFGAKNQSEIIVNKGTRQKITDVYFDGTTALPRGKSSRPRVVVVTETI